MTLTQITEKGIKDGEIINADINASAAIQGSKITPSFTGNISVTNVAPKIFLTDSDHNSDFALRNMHGVFGIHDQTNDVTRLTVDSNGNVRVGSDSLNIAGVGTGPTFAVNGAAPEITLRDTATGNPYAWIATDDNGSLNLAADQGNNASNSAIRFRVDGSEKIRIDNDGNLLIGSTSSVASAQKLQIFDDTDVRMMLINTTTASGQNASLFFAPANSVTGASIICSAEEDFSTAANRTSRLSFSTRKDGTLEEHVRIASDGKVGIQTLSPSKELTVSGASGGGILITTSGSTNGGVLDLENTQGGNQKFRLAVGGGDNAYVQGKGLFVRDETNSANRVAILTNGNVGIAATNPQARLDVRDTNPVVAEFYRSNGGTNDESRIALGALNTNIPSQRGILLTAVNTGSGHDFSLRTSSNHSLGPTEKFKVSAGGDATVTQGNFVIGTAGYGLNFNVTGNATTSGAATSSEIFDDYEEGTWTPVYNSGSSSSACFASGVSYNTGGQTGFYTKIGNIVYFRLNIDASSSGLVAKSGILQINSLPFTAVSQSHVNSGAAFYQFTSAFGTGSGNRPTPVVIQGATYIQFYNQNGTAFAGTDLSGPQQPIQLSGFYEAA